MKSQKNPVIIAQSNGVKEKMTTFIKSFLINTKDLDEKKILIKQNESRFVNQIERSKYIEELKAALLLICILMTFGTQLLMDSNIIQVSDFTLKIGNFTWSGFALANIMHFSYFHLAMNMFALIFFFNRFFFSDWKMLLSIIILSSVGSSVFSLIFAPPDSIVIGASGFLFGLMSFYMMYLYDMKKIYDEKSYNTSPLKRFLLVQGLLCIIINFIPQVAWFAHLGGALVGFMMYFLVKNKLDFSYESFVLTYYKI